MSRAGRYRAVVIGGSAGGVETLSLLLGRLPRGFELPILVAQHLHRSDGGCLAELLDGLGPLPVHEARDKQPVQPGEVVLAPADYHLLVERDETLALSVDEKVNWARPAIDALFDSAARVWGAELVGVLLSGANEDGAAGLGAIKRFGGLTVAQDPRSAVCPAMPQAAISAAAVDRVATPAAIAELLLELSAAGRAGRETDDR